MYVHRENQVLCFIEGPRGMDCSVGPSHPWARPERCAGSLAPSFVFFLDGPEPVAVRSQSLNHWTVREVPLGPSHFVTAAGAPRVVIPFAFLMY